MGWFLALNPVVQMALFGAANTLASTIVGAIIGGIKKLIDKKDSKSDNRLNGQNPTTGS